MELSVFPLTTVLMIFFVGERRHPRLLGAASSPFGAWSLILFFPRSWWQPVGWCSGWCAAIGGF